VGRDLRPALEVAGFEAFLTFSESVDTYNGSWRGALHEVVLILAQYGYLVVFVWVLAEQVGLPIPALPLLLSAGALAGQHKMSLLLLLLTSVIACLVSDTFWYELGKRRGGAVLNVLCRMSLEPDSCVERTRGTFDRRGPQSLLYAKFVPGLNTVAAPIAGMSRVPYSRFLFFDVIGSLIWAASSLVVGYLFSERVDAILQRSQVLGKFIAVLAVLGIVAWIVWKYDQRRRFLKSVMVARITPDELHAKIAAGEEPVIIDLRHPLDFLTDPRTLPGAIQIRMDDLATRAHEIPRGREIILYCT
jgi:membrane protein DedA with SNARE-associated domain